MDLMWFLALAHLIGDYALQSDRMAETKPRSVAVLTAHVLIYVGVIGVALWLYGMATGRYGFWKLTVGGLLVPIFAVHWMQDYLKGHYFPSRQAYYLDQALHISQLLILRLLVA